MAAKRLGIVGTVVGLTAAVGTVALTTGAREDQPTDQLTAVAVRRDLVVETVGTGRVTAASTYALTFGQPPRLLPPAPVAGTVVEDAARPGLDAPGAGTGWPTASVAVGVGARVRKGDVLAEAALAEANRQLAVAQAELKAAEARLAADLKGPSGSEKATAGAGLSEARKQLASALELQRATAAQNRRLVARAGAGVAAASTKLADDRAAGAPPVVLETDARTLDLARQVQQEALTRQRASDEQAAAQVQVARNAVEAAEAEYRGRVGPASAAQIALDDAAVVRARAAVERSVEAVERGRIVAPVDGTVVAVNLEPGIVTARGDPIVIESAARQVRATFGEADVASLEVGQPARIRIPALGTDFAGTVATISPDAAPDPNAVASYEVVVTAEPASAAPVEAGSAAGSPPDWAAARSGMTAELTIATGAATEAITVPSIALQGEAGAYSVEVVDERGAAQTRPVEVGLVTSSLAEIVSGIAEGETIVVGIDSQRQGGLTIGSPGARPPAVSR